MSSTPRFRPHRRFGQLPTVTARQDGIKNITLYPNIHPRVTQYVSVDLPAESKQANILFENYPSRVNLKDINLDLEDGYVVSQNYQRAETLKSDLKPSLTDRAIGTSITVEYLHQGDVKRSYTGTLVRRTKNKIYLSESAGMGRGSVLRELPNNPDHVIYHSYDTDLNQQVEELNPTEKQTTPSCFKIRVANTSSTPDTQYGLFHYNCPGFEWNMYSTIVLANNDQEDFLESFSVYADLNNKTGVDFKNVENIKFVLGEVQTVKEYRVNSSQAQRKFLAGGAYNTIVGGYCNNISSNTAVSTYSINSTNNALTIGYNTPGQHSSRGPQGAQGPTIQPPYQGVQKHLGGVGTFMVNDVTDISNNDITSVLFYRDTNVPVTRRFEYTLDRQTSLENARFNMKLEITREQHRRLSSFIPSSHIIVKARHPDESLVDLSETTKGPTYREESVHFDAGFCDEIRLSQAVVMTDRQMEDHTEYTENRGYSMQTGKMIVRKTKRVTREDFRHDITLTNRSTKTRTLELVLPSDLPIEGEFGAHQEPGDKTYRLFVPVESVSTYKFSVNTTKLYKYTN